MVSISAHLVTKIGKRECTYIVGDVKRRYTYSGRDHIGGRVLIVRILGLFLAAGRVLF